MTKPKHTPRPWKVLGGRNGAMSVYGNKLEVATVKARGYFSPDDPNERQANAALIASAPELYDIAQLVWKKASTSTMERLEDECGPIYTLLKLAIAKAEGESNEHVNQPKDH